jgi:hypothetical protein
MFERITNWVAEKGIITLCWLAGIICAGFLLASIILTLKGTLND